MTRVRQFGFIVVAIGGMSLCQAADAQNRTQLDSPWHPAVNSKTTKTDSGKASFTNDCPVDQTMYVTIKKGFGPVDFVIAPKKALVRSVEKGDRFSARCGVVVAQRASYDWIQLNRP
jgi:hypothetical protein